MKSCRLIINVLIFLLIGYSGCSDKPTDKPDNLHTDHTSSCDKDNNQVTETTEQSCHQPVKDPRTEPYPQPQQPHPEQPTPQDEKHYLLGSQPRKDVGLNLVPITHLEYIPPQAEQQPTEQPSQRQYYPTQPYPPQPYQQYYSGYGPQPTQPTPQPPYQQYYPGYGPEQSQPYYGHYGPQPTQPQYYPPPPVSLPVQQYPQQTQPPLPQPPLPQPQPIPYEQYPVPQYQHGPGYQPPPPPLSVPVQQYPLPQPVHLPQQPQPGYQLESPYQPQPHPPHHPQPQPPYYTGPPIQPVQPYQPVPYEQPQPQPVLYQPTQPVQPGYQPTLGPHYPGYPPQGPYQQQGPTQPPQQHPGPQHYPGYQPVPSQTPYPGPTQPVQPGYQPTLGQPSQVTQYQPTPHPLTQPHTHIGPQPYPRATVPLRQPSNLGPGILGPAPGPLRDPSFLLQNLSHKHIRPSTPHSEKSEQQTKEPTTEAPTKTTKEATTHTQHTQEPQEPTQPSPQHTQYTTEPSELHPETIPVEVGSDEEEEPPEPPRGPGDGDQPPDQPEDGDEGDEDGDEGEPEEEDKEPSKDVKKCKIITLLKMNDEGELVPMTEGDYEIVYDNDDAVKYKFTPTFEELHCDGEIVYKHISRNRKISSLIYNRVRHHFLLKNDLGMYVCNYRKGVWSVFNHKFLRMVYIFTKDSEGNDMFLNSEHYTTDIGDRGSFKYIFKDGVKCTKIMYRNQLVWEKTDHTDNYPIHFYISLKYYFYILFNDHVYKYSKRGTEYHPFSDNLRRQKK